MKSIHPLTKLMCAVACALPLIAMAQTSPTPADVNGAGRNGPPVAPAQGTNPSAMQHPATEGNSTIQNNPTTTYPDANSTTTGDGMNKSKTTRHSMKRGTGTNGKPEALGDVPSYPAKTEDGRPTSPSSDTIPK